jgi:LuxR family transcriptional regulator, maltose regulon positive regulatory protein
LDARAEGWAAGLRLLALALQGCQSEREAKQVLATIASGHRHIAEYIVDEVFANQPPPVQEFLLRTSVLTRLTGSLCDAVVRTENQEPRTAQHSSGSRFLVLGSQALLEKLARANLFLMPLDDAGVWYRYHTLFAEALRQHAGRHFGDEGLRTLYSAASGWYERAGMVSEAIEAGLQARDWERAAALLERAIAPNLVQNEYHTLRRWIDQLPPEALERRPELSMTYATAILFTSERSAPATMALIRRPLEIAERHWQGAEQAHKLAEALAFRSLVTWLQGDHQQAFVSARRALALLPENNLQWRGIALIFAGVEHMWAGDLTAARRSIIAARALCETAGNIYGTLDATLLLGDICAAQAEPHLAAELYRQALATAERGPMDRDQALQRIVQAQLRLGELALEWNDLDGAERYASRSCA